jgi:hypothetical protein
VICGSKLRIRIARRPLLLFRAPLTNIGPQLQILSAAILLLVTGCRKEAATAPSPAVQIVAQQSNMGGPVPQPLPTPTSPKTIAPPSSGNVDETLAQLTRELHRTMIGRKLSGSFEEFVAVRNLQVPPPPPGKKYAISKQWRVILVDQ